jgi:hypothetical protein
MMAPGEGRRKQRSSLMIKAGCDGWNDLLTAARSLRRFVATSPTITSGDARWLKGLSRRGIGVSMRRIEGTSGEIHDAGGTSAPVAGVRRRC